MSSSTARPRPAASARRVDSGAPPPSAAIHCLNGNLLRALIGLGWLDDERVTRSIDWQARTITGEGVERWYASGTSGPLFGCAANEQLPCAWGAIKALLGLARIPAERRTSLVVRAIDAGAGSCSVTTPPLPTTLPAGATCVRAARGSSSASRRVTWRTSSRTSRSSASSATAPIRASVGHRMAALQAGRTGPLAQRVRLQRQDLGRHRAAGPPSKWVTLRASSS